MKLTVDVIESAPISFNPLKEREMKLRGLDIPELENLGATRDQVDCIDLSDNDLRAVENIPTLKRVKMLLFNNNKIATLDPTLGSSVPNLETLILTNNRIAELSEIDVLKHLKQLKTLSLVENPISYRADYRAYIIQLLPQLQFLDFQRISLKERGLPERKTSQKASSETDAVMKDGAKKVSKGKQKQMNELIEQAIRNAKTGDEIAQIEKLLKAGKHADILKLVS